MYYKLEICESTMILKNFFVKRATHRPHNKSLRFFTCIYTFNTWHGSRPHHYILSPLRG